MGASAGVGGTEPPQDERRLSAVSDPWIMCVRDAEGRFVLVNRHFEATFRVRCRDILGKTDEEIFPPAVAAQHRAIAQRVIATGVPLEVQQAVPLAGGSREFVAIEFPVGSSAQAWWGAACVAADVSAQAGRPRIQDHAAFPLDASGRVKAWNHDSEQLFGYAEREMLGQHVSVLYALKDLQSGLPAITLLSAATRCVHEGVAWRRLKDGSEIRANVVTAARLSPEGVPTGFIEVTSRLTLQQQAAAWIGAPAPLGSGRHQDSDTAEQSTKELEELEDAVFRCLHVHVAVLNAAGTIVYVNQAWDEFARTNGVADLSAAGVGANYLDVCRRAAENFSGEAAEALAGISAVLDGTRQDFSLEYPCHSPHAERWFLLTVAPLHVRRTGAVVIHTPITERVLAERQVKQTSEFFQAAVENAMDIVAVVDTAGVFKYVSPSIERVLGYKQNELLGRACFDIAHPSDFSKIRQDLNRLQKPGAMSEPAEVSIRHKEGIWRIMEGVGRNAVNVPSVNGIVVTARDVTERREAELLLQKKELDLQNSQRTLRAMAARLIGAEDAERRRISRELHDDLNQKLAILAVDAGRLARTLPESEAVVIGDELRELQSRLALVCGQVRTMAYQLHPSILDDLGLAVAVRSFCAEFARREGIRVRFWHRNVPRKLPQDHASAIYRIAQEALRNVAKHSSAASATVSIVGSEAGITLTVRDRGAGFRLEAARAHGGLGLTSMEERASILHGTLEIDTRPGAGTRVKACIPWTSNND